MKKAFPFLVLLTLIAAGCGSSDEPSGPAPAFGSKAGPRGGNAPSGGTTAPTPQGPKSRNMDFGG